MKNETIFNDNIVYLLKILHAAITGNKIDIPAEQLDDIKRLAISHKVENFLYYAVNNPTADMKTYYERALFFENYQAIYAQLITDEFEANGIEHMLLKGSVIKYLFPYPEMRQSSDIDIWIAPDKGEEARRIMTELGFKTEHYGLSNHDEYIWNNTVYVELHRELVSEKYQWYEICKSIVDRRVHETNYEYRYKMSNEDFYIFMLIHMAKHIKFGGAGIRLVLDVWIYMNKVSVNKVVLKKRLDEANLTHFNNLIRELCTLWFEDKKTDNQEALNLSCYMINSGWNGTAEQVKMISVIRNQNAGHSKLHRYWTNIFWSKNKMMERYRILEKYPIMLPFCWIHRAFCAVFIKKGKIKEIAHYYDEVQDDSINSYKNFIKSIGL